ncbi:MAG: hypothetical protein DRJ52_02280 [Thermoprotei archaeon]|nr:MAG: hypothetical protein DRJ52_02280 [Thermoprotei archaeon]
MVRETGVSYYGVAYPERAIEDFRDLLEHSCNAVLFGISEFDYWFWHENTFKLIELAKLRGFTVYVDLWGWGKVFGGEPPSIFLQKHHKYRQVSAKGKVYAAACFNTEEFRNYVVERVEELAKESDADYFFWDEPHYAWLKEDWTCRCPTCLKLFKEEYGYEMPKELTKDVVEFRQKKIIEFLKLLSKTVKEADSSKKICVCLLPTTEPIIGIPDWETIAEISEVDMIATDPYWISKGLSREEGIKWFTEFGAKIVELGKKYDKETQLWVQGYRIPRSRVEEVVEGILKAGELGVDSIFVWCYKAGEGSILASEDSKYTWDRIGYAFRKVRIKER